ncbi:MAG: von Willebrand factor type A domain-containing protein [Actinomycetota bacterium]
MGSQRHRLLTVLLAVLLLAAACGSGDDSGGDESSGTADAASSDGDAAPTTAAAQDLSAEDGEAADFAVAEEAMEDDSGVDAGEASEAAGGLFDEAVAVEEERDAEDDNRFVDYGVRPFVPTDVDPLSTFALDVDTASYSIARGWVDGGAVPPIESVRLEEYVNSFSYDYRSPADGLAVSADAGPSPFTEGNVVVRLGVQAEQVANADRPDATLTFVIDTSGSMDRSNRLELVKASLSRLVNELEPRDQIAIVTYSDGADVLLAPTSVEESDVILDAIDSLATTGSTNLEAGLQRGYDLADQAYVDGGINRVILASDGVANVGLTDPDGLAQLIRDDADRGIQLVTVGVGMGNFSDVTMEQLADQGDGFYAYVDTPAEADRLFADDLVSTLLTVAIDGKIQVEFDPSTVAEYRLLGYENRAVLDDDFRNDAVDAGELGAGHQATALYELVLADGVGAGDPLGTAQLRWEDPDTGSVVETRLELAGSVLESSWLDTSTDFRLAVTVASLAEILRDSPHRGDITLEQVRAEAGALEDEIGGGETAELWQLIDDIIALS